MSEPIDPPKQLRLRRFARSAPAEQQPKPKKIKPPSLTKDAHGLNPKQALFLRHYLKLNNATQAAIAAGYSAKTARQGGTVLLSHPVIAAQIAERRAKIIAKLDFGADQAMEELAVMATSNMQDYFEIGEHGQPVLNWSQLTRRQAGALQELTVEEFVDGRSDKRKVRRVKFKLADKQGAIDLWGKFKGVFVEKHDHKHDHRHTLIGVLLDEIDAAGRAKVVEAKVLPPVDDDK
jgi:phage terminase small subunit